MADARQFQLTWARAWIASLGSVIVAVLGIWATQRWIDGDLNTILLQVLSTLLSIGVIAFVYDVAVRRTYTREIIETVGLSSHLLNGGIRRVSEESAIEWRHLFDGASNVVMVLMDASGIAERDWLHLLNASRARETDIRIFTPDPDEPLVDRYARLLEYEPEQFKGVLQRTERSLENGWVNAAEGHPPLRPGSKLRLYRAGFTISYSIIFVDDTAVILLPQIQEREPGQGTLALQFEIDTSGIPGRWLDRQRRRLLDLPDVPYYESPDATH